VPAAVVVLGIDHVAHAAAAIYAMPR